MKDFNELFEDTLAELEEGSSKHQKPILALAKKMEGLMKTASKIEDAAVSATDKIEGSLVKDGFDFEFGVIEEELTNVSNTANELYQALATAVKEINAIGKKF